MIVHEWIRWPLAQNLAYRIAERLDKSPAIEEFRSDHMIRVQGLLPLCDEEFQTKKRALCIFSVPFNWIENIPTVSCLESWITKDRDWHISPKGQLCFELNVKWETELPKLADDYSFGPTADYATEWLLNSTRSLLNRHLFAHRNGIKEWPKPDWDAWAHGKEARETYLKQLWKKQASRTVMKISKTK